MKNKLYKLFFGIFFLGLIIELVIIAPSMLDTSGEDFGPESLESNNIQQKMSGIHLVETRNESKEWELWSDEALTLKNKEAWELKKVRAMFFADEGVTFEVVGDEGAVELQTKNMVIKGDVVTKSSNGYLFKTETMIYDSSTRKLNSPSPVEMLGPKDSMKREMSLTGKAMEADLETSMIEIKNDVRAEKTFKKGKRVAISSQRSQFSGKSKYARFLDDVIIDFDTMRLSGPDAVFHYDQEKDLVSHLMVQGGVKVSDVNKWATSDEVNVEFEKEKFVFKGSPKLVQNNDELKGDEIIFLDGGKRVKVKKAKLKSDETELK